MTNIELPYAIEIALDAHRDQVDKRGEPYILHPLRVMMAAPPELRIAAVLHDVVEDCPRWTLARLEDEGLDAVSLALVDALTRRKGESYSDFLRRVKSCGDGAVTIKMLDIGDNTSPWRALPHNAQKYADAIAFLKS